MWWVLKLVHISEFFILSLHRFYVILVFQTLAKHIMNVHMNAGQSLQDAASEGEISLPLFKKFINYCRL